jgi:CRISPR-associated protein Csm4
LESGRIGVHETACLEFARDAGLWMMVVFADDEARERWEQPLRGALRLLGDTGIGGERSRGWGRFRDPRWEKSDGLSIPLEEGVEPGYWLLSLYAPAETDGVDWNRGSYTTITRSGRVENLARWGALKTPTEMIGEGSVLLAPQEPRGSVLNVAPEGFEHPVYRSGFAVSIPIPWRVSA